MKRPTAPAKEHYGFPLLLVVAAGAMGGIVGIVYLLALRWCESLLGPGHAAIVPHALILVAVGTAVGLIEYLLGNSGDVELLVDNIHVRGGMRGRKELRSLIPVSLLCIAAGGAMGPEAPLVQTTGTLSTWLAERRRLSMEQTRVLTITGMASGFTVLFGAPLGAAIFALEILHRRGMEYYEAILPALIGSVCGYGILAFAQLSQLGPVWTFPAEQPLVPTDLGWALLAGVAGMLLAWAFAFLTRAWRGMFATLPVWIRPAGGGVVLALLAWWSPYALTFGEAQVSSLTGTGVLWAVLATAAAAKLLGTSVTVGSGWRGGFIIPLFFIGVCVARLLHLALPGTNEAMLMAAFMVAINTGVTKTPLGSTLVVTAMAGLHLLPTTLVAALTSLLLSSRLRLITSQRPREPLAVLTQVQPQSQAASA